MMLTSFCESADCGGPVATGIVVECGCGGGGCVVGVDVVHVKRGISCDAGNTRGSRDVGGGGVVVDADVRFICRCGFDVYGDAWYCSA